MTSMHEPAATGVISGQRLIRASALYGLAGALGKGGALITVPVVTRALGPSEYGVLDLATALIGLATIVGGLSAELPAARLAANDPDTRPGILTTYAVAVTGVTALISMLLVIGHQFIATTVWSLPGAGPQLLTAAGAILLTGIQLATWNIHRLQDRPEAYAVLSVLDIGLKVTLIVAAALAGGGVPAILAVYLGVAAIGAVAGLWSVRRDLAWRLVAPSVIPTMLVGGALFTVTGVAFVVGAYVVRSMLSNVEGADAVGEMGVAVRLASVLALPLAAFQFAWGPPSMAAGATVEARLMFRRSTLWVLVAGGLAAIFTAGLAPEAISVLAGRAFVDGAAAVPGLAASTVLGTCLFMLTVDVSGKRAGLPLAALAAVVGAMVQVGVTAVAIVPTGDQTAVGLGAVTGSAVAVLSTLAVAGTRSLEGPQHVGAATLCLVAAVIALQAALALDLTAIRWTAAVVAAAGLLVLLVWRRPWTSALHADG